MGPTSTDPLVQPATIRPAPRQWLRRQEEQVQLLTGPVEGFWVVCMAALEDIPRRRRYEGRVKICASRPQDYFSAEAVWRLAGTGDCDSLMAAVERAERLGLLRLRAMVAAAAKAGNRQRP